MTVREREREREREGERERERESERERERKMQRSIRTVLQFAQAAGVAEGAYGPGLPASSALHTPLPSSMAGRPAARHTHTRTHTH